MNSVEFASYIKTNREKLGWTVKELCELLGIDRMTLPKWESGNVKQIKVKKYLPLFQEVFDRANMTEEELRRVDLVEFMRNMRLSVSWSKQRLGDAIGVSEATIRRWEKTHNFGRHDINEVEMIIREAIKEEVNKRRKAV